MSRARETRPRDLLRLTKMVSMRGMDISPFDAVADVRAFLFHAQRDRRQLRSSGELDKAETSGKITDPTVAVHLVPTDPE